MLAPYRMRAHFASMDDRRIFADGPRVLQQGHTTDDRDTSPGLYEWSACRSFGAQEILSGLFGSWIDS